MRPLSRFYVSVFGSLTDMCYVIISLHLRAQPNPRGRQRRETDSIRTTQERNEQPSLDRTGLDSSQKKEVACAVELLKNDINFDTSNNLESTDEYRNLMQILESLGWTSKKQKDWSESRFYPPSGHSDRGRGFVGVRQVIDFLSTSDIYKEKRERKSTKRYTPAAESKVTTAKRAKTTSKENMKSKNGNSAAGSPSHNTNILKSAFDSMWAVLESRGGFSMEHGPRKQDVRYFPKGINRENGRCRRDWFDGKKILIESLRTDYRWKDDRIVREALRVYDQEVSQAGTHSRRSVKTKGYRHKNNSPVFGTEAAAVGAVSSTRQESSHQALQNPEDVSLSTRRSSLVSDVDCPGETEEVASSSIPSSIR